MRISSYLFPLIPFCMLVGSFFVFAIGIILVLASYGEASADERSKDVKPYGIDRRVPWETSRVVGAPDATDDFSILAREPEQFVEAGKALFNGKGSCYSCHTLNPSVPSGRGPDLTDIRVGAATRKPGMGAKAYLIESLYDPAAFLVHGYGKTMTPAWKPPISLLNLEIEAVIAFLQSQGGAVEEEEETLTLKIEDSPEGMYTVSKSNLKTYVTVLLFDGELIIGALVAENEDQIVLEINGVKRTIDKFDIDEGPTYSRAFGKRINVKSPMPDNYAQLPSIDDHYNLLAFLSTLTGKTLGSESGPIISLRPKKTFTKFPLNQPVYIEPEPGTDQLLVIELGGKIRRFKDDPDAGNAEFLIDTGRETYGLTFHPNYEENGYLYVVSNGPIGGKVTETRNYVSRFTVDRQPPYGCDPNSELIILEWLSNNHNGGDLAFGPDGYLYIPAGDGAMDSDTNLTGLPGSYDRDPKGQDLSNLPATIMRIDVDRPEAGRPYSIPSDNPFIHLEGARPEIWVYGIRNPWRITFDRETGHLWAGNVGQDRWEMIHLVRGGDNYGWSLYEGSHPFFLNRKQGPTPIVKPTVEHPHSEARSITGGVVYYGSKFPELWGAYVYGDYATGKMWALRHDGEKLIWHQEIADTTLQIVSFGIDHNDEILIVDLARGIYQLERKPESTEKFPTRLSETGMFISVKGYIQTDPGLIPYSVNAPLWTDGAHVERFIALPGDSQIEMASNDGVGWSFPDGTALIQTFAFDLETSNSTSRHRIETRLLTRQQGEWVGYSYIWNDE